ncbi:MAG: nicotinate-nucleotide adenylyltransferase [Candidatus Margulisiibacteriota bacterium]
MRKVGVLGGTFNPIHNGHIKLAKKALKEFGLDHILFVPTGLPPHKSSKDLAPKKHRLKMVSEAIKGKRKFKLSKMEINRSGYSYAVDTFNKLQKRLGKRTRLFYVMGLDSINSILNWKKPLELFKMCAFIVATRPGSKMRTFKRLIKFPPLAINKEKIRIIESKMDVSSTEIRSRIKAGKSISKLVPAGVAAYIEQNSLYKERY